MLSTEILFAGRYEMREEVAKTAYCRGMRVLDRITSETLSLKVVEPNQLKAVALCEYKDRLLALRPLAHPNLVRTFAVGEDEGRFYVASEWIEGVTLAHKLEDQGGPTVAARFILARQLCGAVASIHSVGLAHGSINTARILVNRHGVLKLLEALPTPERHSIAQDLHDLGTVLHQLLGEEEIPEALRQGIQACLENKPSKRACTAAELLALLKEISPAGSLADLLDSDPSDPRSLLPILADVLDELDQVHTARQRHGKLSPESVRLAFNGKPRLDLSPEESMHQTAEFGAPKFAAPDLFRKSADEAGACRAVDIYVTGFIFYELLLGRKLFNQQFDGIGGAGDLSWFEWHTNPKARAKPLAELLPEFPVPISALIAQMIEKDPARRTGDLAGLARKVRRMGEATAVNPAVTDMFPVIKPQAGPAKKEPAKRRMLPIAILGLVAVAGSAWFVLRGTGDRVEQKAGMPAALATDSGPMVLIKKEGAPAFYIDKDAVTNERYLRFCVATGRQAPAAPKWDPRYFEKGDSPVIGVTWYDARAFANWAGKRLPSSTEWDRAVPGLSLHTTGGEWAESGDNDPPVIRGSHPPGIQEQETVGFRCAADPGFLKSKHVLEGASR